MLAKYFLKNKIALRFIVSLLIFSSIITIILTGIQLYRDYRTGLENINFLIEQLETSLTGGIENSLWLMDNQALQIQLEGILEIPDVEYVSIWQDGSDFFSRGTIVSKQLIEKTIPISHSYRGKTIELGSLHLVFGLNNLYQSLIYRAIFIAITQAVKTFLVSSFIFILFYFMIARHLIFMTSYMHSSAFGDNKKPLKLMRPDRNDELQILVDAFNRMQRVQQTEIENRQAAEQNLLRVEGRFKRLIDNVDMIPMQGYDDQRRVIYWNKASEKLYGYTTKEALGQKLEDLIIPADVRELVVEGTNNWLKHDIPVPPGEITLVRKDGTPVDVYSSHVMDTDNSGKKEMYCIDVELTAIKKIHNELILAKEQAESASRAKSEFLANMSHEIRTPLNGMLGMLQLMQTTDLNQEQDEYILAAMESSHRLTRLLSDILDLSRVEAGKMGVRKDPFEIRKLMNELYDLFNLTSKQSGIILECLTDESLNRHLLGDHARILQILCNLVGNAFKFTNSGKISVTSRLAPSPHSDKTSVLFSVKDTGIGIAEDILPRLFEPFTQGHEGYTRSYQGAGLGLSICKKLVNLMGGNISVDSQEGSGTTFSFLLTFEHISETDEVLETTNRVDPPKNSLALNILLAEDDPVSALSARIQLEKNGHEVTCVANGSEAVKKLRQNYFDLILMDIQMPVMDGVEATGAIRRGEAGKSNIHIPIIALSAYEMAEDRERFLQAGMNSCASKPLDINQLNAVLQEEINKKTSS